MNSSQPPSLTRSSQPGGRTRVRPAHRISRPHRSSNLAIHHPGAAAPDPAAYGLLSPPRFQPCPPLPVHGQGRPFLDRCQSAVGDAAGPGGAPAAKRGRTTWRSGETTAILGHEEGHRPKITDKQPAPEAHPHKPPARPTPLDTKRRRYAPCPCLCLFPAAAPISGHQAAVPVALAHGPGVSCHDPEDFANRWVQNLCTVKFSSRSWDSGEQ